MKMIQFETTANIPVWINPGVDTGIPTPGKGVGREGWWTTPPDSEGNRFECFYWSLKDSTAMWCKDEPVEP